MEITDDSGNAHIDPDSLEPEERELRFSRLRSANLTAKWTRGNALSIFNVAKRTDEPESLPKNTYSPLSILSWDRVVVARKVRL